MEYIIYHKTSGVYQSNGIIHKSNKVIRTTKSTACNFIINLKADLLVVVVVRKVEAV